jgi:hypothetical protein
MCYGGSTGSSCGINAVVRSFVPHTDRILALDLLARLATLVPPPWMHLTRYHGVFAPHSELRPAVTPAHR